MVGKGRKKRKSPTWQKAEKVCQQGMGMEAVDLLCSRNAHDRNVLVRRAQWKINQPPSLKRERASWEVSYWLLAAALLGEGRVSARARVGRVRSLGFLSFLRMRYPDVHTWGTIEGLTSQDSFPKSANLGQHEQSVHERAKPEIYRAEDRLVHRILRAGE